jgi:hypothetical protein
MPIAEMPFIRARSRDDRGRRCLLPNKPIYLPTTRRRRSRPR